MTQIIVDVPDDMLTFVMELLDKLDLQVTSQDIDPISEEEADELERRVLDYQNNPEQVKSWEQMEEELKLKYGKNPL